MKFGGIAEFRIVPDLGASHAGDGDGVEMMRQYSVVVEMVVF